MFPKENKFLHTQKKEEEKKSDQGKYTLTPIEDI
jgi:hypothetical protein